MSEPDSMNLQDVIPEASDGETHNEPATIGYLIIALVIALILLMIFCGGWVFIQQAHGAALDTYPYISDSNCYTAVVRWHKPESELSMDTTGWIWLESWDGSRQSKVSRIQYLNGNIYDDYEFWSILDRPQPEGHEWWLQGYIQVGGVLYFVQERQLLKCGTWIPFLGG